MVFLTTCNFMLALFEEASGSYKLVLSCLVLGGPASGYHRPSCSQVSVPYCKGDFQSPNSAPEGKRERGTLERVYRPTVGGYYYITLFLLC